MKKILISITLGISLFVFDKVLPQNKTIEILKSTPIYNQIVSLIKKGKIKVKSTLKDNFYIIEVTTPKGKALIYVTKNKKYTIIGKILKQNGQLLMPNFPKNAEIIKKGVMFTFGKGKKDIYIVTDPQCPFCRMMEKQKKIF